MCVCVCVCVCASVVFSPQLMEKADQQRVDELTVQYEKMTKEFQEKRDK